MASQTFHDNQRRFGGLQRLYGPHVLDRLAASHVLVAGLGGVGAWCAEALARCGIGRLTLVDLDHISESNINRQLHALTHTLGQSKIVAMQERILAINSGCRVRLIDDFVTAENVASVFAEAPDVVIDCTDQVQAKVAMILQGRTQDTPVLVCGGAGGKTDPLAMRFGDLAHATHDALLARIRQNLRRGHRFPGVRPGKKPARAPRMGVPALWLAQEAILPDQWRSAVLDVPVHEGQGVGGLHVSGPSATPGSLQGLSCAGYGSVVTVTASMGMAAAHQALDMLLARKSCNRSASSAGVSSMG